MFQIILKYIAILTSRYVFYFCVSSVIYIFGNMFSNFRNFFRKSYLTISSSLVAFERRSRFIVLIYYVKTNRICTRTRYLSEYWLYVFISNIIIYDSFFHLTINFKNEIDGLLLIISKYNNVGDF